MVRLRRNDNEVLGEEGQRGAVLELDRRRAGRTLDGRIVVRQPDLPYQERRPPY